MILCMSMSSFSLAWFVGGMLRTVVLPVSPTHLNLPELIIHHDHVMAHVCEQSTTCQTDIQSAIFLVKVVSPHWPVQNSPPKTD